MPGRRTRRQWGWHPLTADWAERIVAGAPVGPGDLVVDLGAGTGALTAPLVASGATVVAVELHPGRAAHLRTAYADAPVTVVVTDLAGLRLPRRPFRVVASPPYAASTAALRLLLGTDRLLSADLVLQRAAAVRLVGRPPPGRHAGRYRLEVGASLPRRAFRLPPRVDSAVLRVRRRRPV